MHTKQEIWMASLKWNGMTVYIVGTVNHLIASDFNVSPIKGKVPKKTLTSSEKKQILRWLDAGHPIKGPFKIDLRGTTFQKKVWKAIMTIPRGKTISYKQLAKRAGRPKAIRAAANACGTNPLPLIVPCHRVISSDGTIGGFSSNINNKKKLLKLEQS